MGLRYQTTYRYEEAVGFSPHEVRLFPRSDRFSRVRRLDFTTVPKATVRFSRDVFENTVASCFFPERSKELEFRLSINLDLDEKDPFHFILENDAVETPFEYEPAIGETARGLPGQAHERPAGRARMGAADEQESPRYRHDVWSSLTRGCMNASVTSDAKKARRCRPQKRSGWAAAPAAM